MIRPANPRNVLKLALSLCALAILAAGCAEWRNAEPRHPATDGAMKDGSANRWTVEGNGAATPTTQPMR